MSDLGKTKRAAAKAEAKLSGVAPLLLRMLRRSIFGVKHEAAKERLGLAELEVLLQRMERGAVKSCLADVTATQDKVRDLVAQKAADDAATAVATIEAARVTAVADMTAMGLSAARTATLTTIIGTLATTAKTAATTAAESAARGGANRVLNRTSNEQTAKLTDLDDKIQTFKNAIEAEGVRLGIRI